METPSKRAEEESQILLWKTMHSGQLAKEMHHGLEGRRTLARIFRRPALLRELRVPNEGPQ